MNEPRTRVDLASLVPDGGTIIELGVAAGRFAEQLLVENRGVAYIGIDRWADHHDDAEMQSVIVRLSPWQERVRIIRASFAEALPMIEDASVDLIYIDGYAHTGQEGGQTLRDWWPKLAHSGIFAGHDYDPRAYPQTVEAVDEFARQRGLSSCLRIIDEHPHSSWWIRRPMGEGESLSDIAKDRTG